jgi:hypothetical protein
MTIRPMQVYALGLNQVSADFPITGVIDIETSGQRAIQIYQITGAFNLSDLFPAMSTATPSFVSCIVGCANRAGGTSDYRKLYEASIPTFACKGDFDWKAPTALIIGKEKLVIDLYSDSTGNVQNVELQIYYRTIVVTDVQLLQLRKM